MADRAVSTTLNYAFAIAIITLLISGIFIGMGSFVEDQRERAVVSQLDILGNRLAADITAVDQMVINRDSVETAQIRTALPGTAAGRNYRLAVSDASGDGVHRIDLTTSDPDVTVTVLLKTETEVASTVISGGDVLIVFDGTRLEVRRA